MARRSPVEEEEEAEEEGGGAGGLARACRGSGAEAAPDEPRLLGRPPGPAPRPPLRAPLPRAGLGTKRRAGALGAAGSGPAGSEEGGVWGKTLENGEVAKAGRLMVDLPASATRVPVEGEEEDACSGERPARVTPGEAMRR